MNEQILEAEILDQSPCRHRIEPDWADSEWFQVWLELARLPHKTPAIELALEPSAVSPSEYCLLLTTA